MANLEISNPTNLENTLNSLLREIHGNHAKAILHEMLISHLIGLMVKNAENPEEYFNQFRNSSRENISEGINFHPGGDVEANQLLIEMALEGHEKLFVELSRVLGFSEE